MADLAAPFVPVAIEYEGWTELIIRDCVTVVRSPGVRPVELLYDVETGALVGVRVAGHVSGITPRGLRKLD